MTPAHTLFHPGPGGRAGRHSPRICCRSSIGRSSRTPAGRGRHSAAERAPGRLHGHLRARVRRSRRDLADGAEAIARRTRGRAATLACVRDARRICPTLRARLNATAALIVPARPARPEGVSRRGRPRIRARTRSSAAHARGTSSRSRSSSCASATGVASPAHPGAAPRVLARDFGTLSVAAALEALRSRPTPSSARGARRCGCTIGAPGNWCSPPRPSRATPRRARTSRPSSEATAARGLRLERPQIAAEAQERVLIAPLARLAARARHDRDRRRGRGRRDRRPRRSAAHRRRVRPRTAAVHRDRERAAARGSPAAPPAAGRHVQLPHRPRRRHRQRACASCR